MLLLMYVACSFSTIIGSDLSCPSPVPIFAVIGVGYFVALADWLVVGCLARACRRVHMRPAF